jgi:hypothetical protein
VALSAGDAYLDTHFRLARDFDRQMVRQVQGPAGRAGEEASRHFGRRFAHGLKTAGVAIGVGLAAAAVLATRGVLATTKAASDLNETVNKTKVIFGSSSKAILAWSRGSANAFGLSRNEALAAAASFGDMFLQLGLGQKPATNMSMRMVKLAADLASFNNVSGGAAEVSDMLSSAFRGEFDSLQRLVPNINAARVEQEALRETHKKSAKDLTAADKALATYNIVIRDSARANDDFARTSNDLANMQRKQQAGWENLKAVIGRGFLPAQLAVTRVITEKLLPAGAALAAEFGPRVGKAVTAAAEAFARSVPPATELAETARMLGPRLDRLVPTGERIGTALGRLVARAQELRPELRGLHGDSARLATTWRLSGAALDFLGDHLDLVVKALPALVVGYGLVKAAQAAANLAAAAEVVLAPARIAANIALSRSQRALTAALREQAAMSGVATVAQGRLTAAEVAGTAAAGGAAAKVGLLGRAVGLLGRTGPLIAFAAAVAVGTENLKRFREKGIRANLGDPVSISIGMVRDAFVKLTGKSDGGKASMARFNSISTTAKETVKGFGAQVDGGSGKLGRFSAALGTSKVTASAATIEFRRLVTQANSPQIDAARGRVDLLTRGMGRSKVSASDAAREMRRFGNDAAAAMRKPQNRHVTITATADVDATRRTIRLNNQFGGKVLLAEGGWVWGPGTETSDSVRARLSRGEFVVNARSAKRHRAQLEAINAARFARGGPVGESGDAKGVVVVPGTGSVSPLERRLPRVVALAERLGVNVAGRTAKAVATAMAKGIADLARGGASGGVGGGPGIVNAVIKTMARAIGQPYLWGGSSWPRFDCSGLMQWGFRQHGIRIPRVSRAQAQGGRPGTGERGDLVFFDRGNIHHVAMVLGGRMMLEAPHTGAFVRVRSYAGRSVDRYRRYFGGTTMGHAVADSGAWLPPRSTTVVTNSTGAWEPVGPPGAGHGHDIYLDGRLVGRALAPGMHAGLLAHKRGPMGGAALGLA